jgi:5-methyltetrahydrofolate--homocysteine methyltransferase
MRTLDILGKGIVVFDGAMGTMLQTMGLPAGYTPDAWCLEQPEAVAEVHRRYVEAGAQVVETNTFGATPLRLAHYGLREKTREIVLAAVRIAREACQGRALVAGCIGPLGTLVEPLGDLSFDQAYEAFSVQAKAFAEARPDLIVIDTIADLNEMRAAILACKDNAPGIPLITQMTMDLRGRSFTGTSPETAGLVMQSMGADVIGFNCSVGPDLLVDAVARVAKVARVPVCVQPNAGLPRLTRDGRTEFPMGPEEFASYGPKLVEAGASIVGGCCGTTPEHIRLLRGAVAGLWPGQGARGAAAGDAGQSAFRGVGVLGREFALSSRTQAVFATEENLPIVIGERINPTGRKALSRDISEGLFAHVREEAKRQAAAGAQVLDVNVGVPLIDEAAAMTGAVRTVQDAVPLPICIDSTSPAAIEAGLRSFVGKALVNSFSLEEGKAEQILPLARRYGAAIIGLTIDEKGIPSSAAERLNIARRLVEKAASFGIPAWDVVVDPLALTAGAQQAQAAETLKAVRMIKAEVGCRTSLGVSNVSYGLPNRPFLNAVFLNMALSAGLDMAIVNPMDERVMDTVRAVRVLLNRDVNSKEYIAVIGPKRLAHSEEEAPAKRAAEAPGPVPTAGTVGRRLYDAVLEGDKDGIAPLVEQALREGASPMEALDNCLIPAINEVGRLFGAGVYFLPQLMLSAAAMKTAFDLLKPEISRVKAAEGGVAGDRGVIVMATVQGDIHDIGKNIVAVLLENYGFRVVDLGRDVTPDVILKESRKAKADMVCLSALMTTTMPRMKDVVDLFGREGFECPVLVGGAATTRSFAEHIGAAGHGRDAQEAVSEALRIMRERRNTA